MSFKPTSVSEVTYSSSNVIRQFYYYIVMLISLFFLVIGMFNLLRVGYIANFAPLLAEKEISQSSNYFEDNPCFSHTSYTSKDAQPTLVEKDDAKCTAFIVKNRPLWLQENLTWSVLSVVLASFVMLVHYMLIGKNLRSRL